MPITGRLDGKGQTDGMLARVNSLREVGFTYRERRYRQRERIYVARVPAFEPSADGLEDEEVGMLRAHRWWTAAEIERSDARFGPRRLGSLLRTLLSEGLPPEPIDLDC